MPRKIDCKIPPWLTLLVKKLDKVTDATQILNLLFMLAENV